MKTAPRPLFFTGGTALAALSRELAKRDLPSIHIVSTFDSGGSTGELRRVYAIPAVGDLRNRLLALASPAIPHSVIDFCASRLQSGNPQVLRQYLCEIEKKQSPVWAAMPPHIAKMLRRYLNYFLEKMSDRFNPSGACIGNLLIAGSYLEHNHNFEPVVASFRQLLQCGGVVAPPVEGSYYLGARLTNGEVVVGQHLFGHLPAAVERLFLTVHADRAKISEDFSECHPPVTHIAAHYIQHAQAVCYPMGSFFSSVVANLLPKGVGRAIANNKNIKIFIPNSGHDPELGKLDIAAQAAVILSYLKADAPEAKNTDLLNLVLVDAQNGVYPGGLKTAIRRRLEEMGLLLVNAPIVSASNSCAHESGVLTDFLQDIMANAV